MSEPPVFRDLLRRHRMAAAFGDIQGYSAVGGRDLPDQVKRRRQDVTHRFGMTFAGPGSKARQGSARLPRNDASPSGGAPDQCRQPLHKCYLHLGTLGNDFLAVIWPGRPDSPLPTYSLHAD